MTEPLSPARQRLVLRFMPLARSLCRPFLVAWSSRRDELISAADLALVDAAARYQPSRGRFSTYATLRIVYGLRDEVRRFCDEEQTNVNVNSLLDALPEGKPRRGSSSHVGAELESIDETEHLIGGFPVQYRPLIRLLFIDGLSMAEVARHDGVTRSAILKRLRDAITGRYPLRSA
jgi:RNA polymerase sigma factor (sigma-70 family)